MRRSSESTGIEKAGNDRRPVDRGRMLQSAQQRPQGNADQYPIPVEFLIAFVRHMIRNNPSQDCILMAMSSAAREFGISEAQSKEFIKAVMHETKQSAWPPGFF